MNVKPEHARSSYLLIKQTTQQKHSVPVLSNSLSVSFLFFVSCGFLTWARHSDRLIGHVVKDSWRNPCLALWVVSWTTTHLDVKLWWLKLHNHQTEKHGYSEVSLWPDLAVVIECEFSGAQKTKGLFLFVWSWLFSIQSDQVTKSDWRSKDVRSLVMIWCWIESLPDDFSTRSLRNCPTFQRIRARSSVLRRSPIPQQIRARFLAATGGPEGAELARGLHVGIHLPSLPCNTELPLPHCIPRRQSGKVRLALRYQNTFTSKNTEIMLWTWSQNKSSQSGLCCKTRDTLSQEACFLWWLVRRQLVVCTYSYVGV